MPMKLKLKFLGRIRRSAGRSERRLVLDTTFGSSSRPLEKTQLSNGTVMLDTTSRSHTVPTQVALAQSALSTTINLSSPRMESSARRRTRHKSTAVAKDMLVFSLEALSQSSDAFPPLKSAVGGLLFFVAQAEVCVQWRL